jgi:hypothetical protein
MAFLTAALIVKDEPARLVRCLASGADLVHPVVVVDTGSTDDTVAIATPAGDTVAVRRGAQHEPALRPPLLLHDTSAGLAMIASLSRRSGAAAGAGAAPGFVPASSTVPVTTPPGGWR